METSNNSVTKGNNTMTISPVVGETASAVLTRLYSGITHPPGQEHRHGRPDPADYAEFGFPVTSSQGELLYFLVRCTGATRVVEFATSFGLSTIYLAAGVRDNGGGLVTGSELLSHKADLAQEHLAQAGLADYVDIRRGDARETLRDVRGPIDLALIDGWPTDETPSLARTVAELLAPRLEVGAVMVNDNAEPDYLEYVRDDKNGFRSINVHLDRATELSFKD